MKKDHTGIIPSQYTGVEIEVEASEEFSDEKASLAFYEKAKNRLLNVNKWHDLAGMASAEFHVLDPSGNEREGPVQKGDFLKINIPGPASPEGEGYDWVRVEDIREIDMGAIQSTAFRVRPTQNPFTENNETAHFYSPESTSNFIVSREGNKVSAGVIDRNTKPNEEPENLLDKIRDKLVSATAVGIFSKVQWQSLVNGIVSNDGEKL